MPGKGDRCVFVAEGPTADDGTEGGRGRLEAVLVGGR